MRVPPPGDAVPTERASGGPVNGNGLIPLDGCVIPLRQQSREARYYAAVHADTVQRGARAAMALADEELAEMRADVEALAHTLRSVVPNEVEVDANGCSCRTGPYAGFQRNPIDPACPMHGEPLRHGDGDCLVWRPDGSHTLLREPPR